MSSRRQHAFQSGGTTFHYRLQGPVISFQSTLWKQQNVIMFSGCFQHYIATIYFHFICLSNTGASSGNCFRLQRVSVHEKSSFSPPISWEPQWRTTLNGSLEQLRSSTFVKLFLSFFFFVGGGYQRNREIALTSVSFPMFASKVGTDNWWPASPGGPF